MEKVYEYAAAVLAEVKRAIAGKDACITKAFATILAGGHILIEDVPGVGKTTLAIAFSRVMGLLDHRVQFTPDVLPADIVGLTCTRKRRDSLCTIRERSCVICFLLMRSTGLRQRHSPRFLR